MGSHVLAYVLSLLKFYLVADEASKAETALSGSVNFIIVGIGRLWQR